VSSEKTGKRDRMPIYDFIGGALLVIGCAFFSYESITLRRPAGWLTAPGLTPLFIFLSMGFMGLFLFIDGIRQNGLHLLRQELGNASVKAGLINGFLRNKITLLVGIFFLYYVVLTQILPFELSTFFYLSVTLKMFWKRSLFITLVTSILIAVSLSLVLAKIFNVVLPGVPFNELKFW
jgi:hypothetical protein